MTLAPLASTTVKARPWLDRLELRVVSQSVEEVRGVRRGGGG